MNGLDVGLAQPPVFVMRIADRIELPPGIGDLQQQHDIRAHYESATVFAPAEIVGRREIHAPADINHRGVQRFSQLHQPFHPFL